ncbi:MAG: acyl-CoA dehydrogenase family protein [Dehalococcoidia bacterium]|nr:acyl-CoA dehydrogenase family protein [Dehalococcoidia bacterium]MCB9485468.1 acyl-CoA dehydrogenase family protein [Thermoflexaceae bacterium]
MDFELSEEHRLIKDTARRIARDVIAPRAKEVDETGEYPHDFFDAFKKAGLLGMAIPESMGGTGNGILPICLAIEEVAKYECGAGLMLVLSGLPTRPIVFGGNAAQQQQYLPGLANGDTKAAFCLTEPDHGSDAAALETRAVRDGDDYVLNGNKVYISGGTVADYLTVFARTGGPGAKGISAFVVDAHAPGINIDRTDDKMGVRSVPTAHFSFQDVRVPAENLLGGAEGNGFNHAMITLNSMRPTVGARGVGLAEGAAAYALEWARDRSAFGSSVVDFQAIQFMFADMAIEIEAARNLVYKAAWLVDQGKYGREYAHNLSIAKAYATEMANRVAFNALQVLGAQGYMKDHPLERHYRDARQLMIVEGTSQVQRVVISRAMLDRSLVYG